MAGRRVTAMMTAAMMVETCGSGVHWYVVYRLVFVLWPAIRVFIDSLHYHCYIIRTMTKRAEKVDNT